MFGLGVTEILAVGAIVFVFFGAKKLPQLGSSLAKGIKNFQSGLQGKDDGQTPKIDNTQSKTNISENSSNSD